MYRIELSPGEETAFRSIEELAVAIRRKVVTPRARIYHNATSKWLPIQFHPHYKIAVSMPLTQADLVAGPPVAPLSSLKLGEAQSPPPVPPAPSSREAATQAALAAWPAPKPVSPPPAKEAVAPAPRVPVEAPILLGTPAPQPARVVQPSRPDPVRMEEPRIVPPARPGPAQGKGSRKRRKSTRSLHIALAGAVLAACAQLVISGASSRASDVVARVRSPRRLIEATAQAMTEDSPRTVAGVLPALQTIPLPHKPAFINRPAKRAPVAPAPAAHPPEVTADIPGPIVDSAPIPEIQPAPDAEDITIGVPAAPALVPPKGEDSTSKKTLNRLLHTIGGRPAGETSAPKH